MAHAKQKKNGQKEDGILKAVGVFEGDIPRAPEIESRIADVIDEKQSELKSRIRELEDEIDNQVDRRKESEKEVKRIRNEINERQFDSLHDKLHELQKAITDLINGIRGESRALHSWAGKKQTEKSLFHKLRGRVYKCVAGRLRERARKWDQHKNIVEHREEILQAQKEARKTVERWQRHFDEDDSFLFKAGPWDVWMHDIEELVGLDEA